MACDGVTCVNNESCRSWWNPIDLVTESACYCDHGFLKTDAGHCMQSVYAENVFMQNITLNTDLTILDDTTAESFALSMLYPTLKDDMAIFAIIPMAPVPDIYNCDVLCNNGYCALIEDDSHNFSPVCQCNSGFEMNEDGNGCVSSS